VGIACEVLIEGNASGTALRLDAPISFWGGVDPETSAICLAGHPQEGVRIAGTVLVIERLIGSSSSSAVMLELLYRGIGPAALILGGRDAILPIGSLVAGQMGWAACPVMLLEKPQFQTAETLRIEAGMIYSASD
jgi:predicted aconitase with swiveling domain